MNTEAVRTEEQSLSCTVVSNEMISVSCSKRSSCRYFEKGSDSESSKRITGTGYRRQALIAIKWT